MKNYSDKFCSIDFDYREVQEGQAWYSDISMNAFSIPEMWAKKIVTELKNRNYKKGLHMIDMVEILRKRKRR